MIRTRCFPIASARMLAAGAPLGLTKFRNLRIREL